MKRLPYILARVKRNLDLLPSGTLGASESVPLPAVWALGELQIAEREVEGVVIDGGDVQRAGIGAMVQRPGDRCCPVVAPRDVEAWGRPYRRPCRLSRRPAAPLLQIDDGAGEGVVVEELTEQIEWGECGGGIHRLLVDGTANAIPAMRNGIPQCRLAVDALSVNSSAAASVLINSAQRV